MTDIACRPAGELTAAIRNREISSRELLDHLLERVERLNPRINAVITLDVERARERADAADAALARGESWGPLHGLPITVKDCFETAGLRTTCSAPQLADHVPERNAIAVERLLAAGAVLFGKTNTPTFAMDWQTYNPLHGTTRNPWNTDRTPGGSSGGISRPAWRPRGARRTDCRWASRSSPPTSRTAPRSTWRGTSRTRSGASSPRRNSARTPGLPAGASWGKGME